jgi:Yip1-like protein
MNLIARVRNILFSPASEWAVIERESDEPIHLFIRYAAILAVIPALAGFIGASFVGVKVAVGTFRVPMLTGLVQAAIGYLFTFVIVYVVALVVDALAPYFRGRRNFLSALKLSVYSFTPVWLAGIFLLIPGLRFLTILGLYGVYLLWSGLPALMRVPREATFACTALVAVMAIVITLLLAWLQSIILP